MFSVFVIALCSFILFIYFLLGRPTSAEINHIGDKYVYVDVEYGYGWKYRTFIARVEEEEIHFDFWTDKQIVANQRIREMCTYVICTNNKKVNFPYKLLLKKTKN